MLNAKQSFFACEYVVDGNATQAAIRAGYSAKSAYSVGSENLKKPEVAAEVARLKGERIERLNLSADYVLENIARVAKEAREQGQWSAALKGYELLGKHLGLFTDRTELTGKDGNTLEVTVRRVGD